MATLSAIRKIALGLLAVLLIVTSLAIPEAAADSHTLGGDSTVDWDLENRIEVPFNPTSGAVEETTTVEVCGLWVWVSLGDPDNPAAGYNRCEWVFKCYTERIDDVLTGIEAGTGRTDGYREYFEYIEGGIAAFISSIPFINGAPGITPETITTAIIENSLGDPTSIMALPVFTYCRKGEGGDLITVAPVGFPTRGPELEWTTTIAAEYDIPGRRIIILDTLRARLEGEVPEPRMVPELAGGFTYVQFPTWFWLEDPVEFDGLWAESVGQTIRLSARATLEEVIWEFGDGRPELPCTLDQMESYVAGADPSEAPDCHRVFEQLDPFALTATAVYKVEEQVSYKLARADPYPDAPWVTHPDQIVVTSDVADVDIHQLVALNVYNN